MTQFNSNSASDNGAAVGGFSVTMNGGCIVGNGSGSVLAVFSPNGASFDFSENWWGDASGPSGSGPGSGDSVSSGVNYSNLLTTPPVDCAPPTPTPTPSPTLTQTPTLTPTPNCSIQYNYDLRVAPLANITIQNLPILAGGVWIPAYGSYVSGEGYKYLDPTIRGTRGSGSNRYHSTLSLRIDFAEPLPLSSFKMETQSPGGHQLILYATDGTFVTASHADGWLRWFGWQNDTYPYNNGPLLSKYFTHAVYNGGWDHPSSPTWQTSYVRGLSYSLRSCPFLPPTSTPTPTPAETSTPSPTPEICTGDNMEMQASSSIMSCLTPTATPIMYSCRVKPNVTIDGYLTAEEAVSLFTTPSPPVSFTSSDILRVDRRASLYENVVRVENESSPGIWYWIDSGIGVTVESGANCDELQFDTMGMYAVRIITDGTRAWDEPGTNQYPDYGNRFFERQSIITALDQIGIAFNSISSTVNSPQSAFNLVMLENSGTEILLIRTQSGDPTVTISNYTYLFGELADQTVTLTYPNASLGYCLAQSEVRITIGQTITRRPAAIICNGNLRDQYDGTTQRLRASQYTIVHELGHIFDAKTYTLEQLGGISRYIEDPGFSLLDCNFERIIFGGSNFTRGRRGWGTGPQQYYNASQTPVALVTNFQQNTTNIAIEAAADLFLNWVYRLNATGLQVEQDPCVVTATPTATYTGPGYRNLEWSETPAPALITNSEGITGAYDESRPGDRRQYNIDQRIRNIFNDNEWD